MNPLSLQLMQKRIHANNTGSYITQRIKVSIPQKLYYFCIVLSELKVHAGTSPTLRCHTMGTWARGGSSAYTFIRWKGRSGSPVDPNPPVRQHLRSLTSLSCSLYDIYFAIIHISVNTIITYAIKKILQTRSNCAFIVDLGLPVHIRRFFR